MELTCVAWVESLNTRDTSRGKTHCICQNALYLSKRILSVKNLRNFFNYNQQDATSFDSLFLKGSTCFGLFLRPSSGTKICTHSFTHCQTVLLQAGIVNEMELSPISFTIPEAHLIHDRWNSVPFHPRYLRSISSTIPEFYLIHDKWNSVSSNPR